MIPNNETNEVNNLFSKEQEVPLRCTKIIYSSRTHSQLEQFISEFNKTHFNLRVLTAASRQALCINDTVKSLKIPGLINDRCNELRSGIKPKSTQKRIRSADGVMVFFYLN